MRNRPSAHPRRGWRVASLAAVVLSLGVLTLAGLHATAHASVGSPVDAGAAIVVDPVNPAKQLTSGGSATKFTLRLPADASCPGDSEHDQWRVQSFVVPATDDPGALRYGEIAPVGDGLWSLYSVDTHAFAQILTLPNSQAGLPGRIDTMPAFSFILFPPGTLHDGSYRVGIACTYFRETAKYWDAVLTLSTAPTDEPGKLVWHAVDAPVTSASSSGSSTGEWFVGGAGVLAVASIAVLLWQRNPRRNRPLLKEHS